ncbi:endonuclease/exonuclease/phosphatase family protein [Yasminevirus sp. GU-2018]|uniref:Endonuclease/exonuclease/phosphatase family protein n=1 Tax=Yasminevirus sp. GU-2018 TaxID=2420051 RepID=A0A5K0UBI8_9VIRU|nr:endonuclease/exonuclease/phosphatase family protein [Yasminevirus sp. GU-2018]
MALPIKVLTWNVCWGCMSADHTSKHDMTAYNLSTKCENDRVTNAGQHVCLPNVVDSIDTFTESYDFVALQEAKNWEDIQNQSNKLKVMGVVHHALYIGPAKNVKVDLVTFYNRNRYRLLALKTGNVVPGDGRPFHIALFSDLASGERVIFINVHNGHGVSRSALEAKLASFSEGVDVSTLPSGPMQGVVKDADKAVVLSISKLVEFDKPTTVILAGDLNDHANIGYWRGLNLFSSDPVKNIQNTLIKSSTEPPKTCCNPWGNGPIRSGKNQEKTLGDYIIASLTHDLSQKTPDNFEYDANKKPTSDHLPVEAVLTPTQEYASLFVVPTVTPTVIPTGIPPAPKKKKKTGKKPNKNLTGNISDSSDIEPDDQTDAPPVLQDKPSGLVASTKVVAKPTENIVFKMSGRYTIPQNNTIFVSGSERTLRLKDKPADPDKSSDVDFRGPVIGVENDLIYPNAEIILGDDGKKYLLVSDVANDSCVGYVDVDNLVAHDFGSYLRPKADALLIRKIPINEGKQPIVMAKYTVTGTSMLDPIVSRGRITSNGFVLVRDRANPNVYGYVRATYLTKKASQKGGYLNFLQAKNDYLNLVNLSQN